MSDFTFLTEEQIFGKEKLEIFEKYGTKAAITDFSILLGGYVSNYHTSGEISLKNRTGYWWTYSYVGHGAAYLVSKDGYENWNDVDFRNDGARPAVSFSSISAFSSNKVRLINGLFEVEYGEYPQTIVSEAISIKLEKAYQKETIKKTGKEYTTDSVFIEAFSSKFEARTHTEYKYNGKKYIRFVGDINCEDEILSDGRNIQENNAYWVEVEPIKWLVDEKNDIALSKNILFSGVRYADEETYTGDFEKTEMKMFLDTYFAKDIIPSKIISKSVENTTKKTRLQKLNPDTNIENKRKMTDTELIKMWIDNGESVLLRGPSGIGKTERIKTLYPNLIYIKLTNNMFPEKVVGSVNLQTGEELPPSFAKEIILSLATEEEKKQVSENIRELYNISNTIYERSKSSNEKIVILLDELLNVKPAVQSLVYTLVLNKLVETGKGLKLPANTVIVATGNQKKYSSVAEDLAEPLEKRFDHILDMYPKVNEWINEYAIPNKVHPSVIGYILSKYRENMRNNTIDYFYEEPEVGENNLDKNGCKGKTNDPRGWVSISNFLYGFERNLNLGKFIGKDVEEILKVSLKTKLREEWAEEFYDFYNIPVLTVEEVVSNNFTQADLPVDTNERFALVTSLISANNEEVGICREFIRKYCDPEYLSIYDLCWIGNSIEKAEIISELQSSAKSLVKTINKVGQ